MGQRILVVDDDRDLVESIGEALSLEGYEVITANDGDKGWEMIKKGKPDLIVLDVMMPGKHGYQVAKELADSDYSSIPVIMLTGVAEHIHDTNFSHAQAMECPADDFIGKPVNVEVLLASVKKLLKKKST